VNRRQFNLDAKQAIARMQTELTRMQQDTDRQQLRGTSPDDAFEAGYKVALHDLMSLTGPDPRIPGLVTDDDLEPGDTFITEENSK
jgi:hypothetical protein